MRNRLLPALFWTLVAAALFAGFGSIAAAALALTLRQVGVIEVGAVGWVTAVARTCAGVMLLVLSRIYRHAAGEDNSGSLAAWLAGWGLLLYAGAALVSRVSVSLAVAGLILVLVAWTYSRLRDLTRRRRGDGGR